MNLPLLGKVVLVTGAGRGIGRAIAMAMAEAGADVAINYLRQRDAAEEVAHSVRALGRRACVCRADVAHADEVFALVAQVEAALAGPDVLVNNATYTAPHSWKLGIEAIAHEDWERAIAVDLSGTFHCMRAVLRPMRARGGGAIINLSSSAALQGDATVLLYTAVKAGIDGLTKSFARALAPQIRVNAIAPGAIATEWVQQWQVSDAEVRDLVSATPLQRMGTPDDIARVAVFLASPASSYMTGQTLVVDGGVYTP